jgi:hypothetical protein
VKLRGASGGEGSGFALGTWGLGHVAAERGKQLLVVQRGGLGRLHLRVQLA